MDEYKYLDELTDETRKMIIDDLKAGKKNLLKLPTCEIASRPRKISVQGHERTLCSQVWLETAP